MNTDSTKKTHQYRAVMRGGNINVFDPEKHEVPVTFAGTEDLRTACAYVWGLGFIGGWQLPGPQRFEDLAANINEGILYDDVSELPGGHHRRKPIDARSAE